MRFQAAMIAALMCGAFLAVPWLYAHRWDAVAYGAGVWLFVIMPPLAGVFFQPNPARPMTVVAATLILGCPLVYMTTDHMHARAEVLRDSYFLGSFTVASMVAGAWLRSSWRDRQWPIAALSLTCAFGGSFGAFVLITLVLYLE
jgi:hypothetical protein